MTTTSAPSCGARELERRDREEGGGAVRLHIDNKGGVWNIDYESEPMPESRFRALCGIAYALIASAAFIGLFALLAR